MRASWGPHGGPCLGVAGLLLERLVAAALRRRPAPALTRPHPCPPPHAPCPTQAPSYRRSACGAAVHSPGRARAHNAGSRAVAPPPI
jgi:hypothetical protein